MDALSLVPKLVYSFIVFIFFFHAQSPSAPTGAVANHTFNTTEANFSLHLCKAAYCDVDAIADWDCGPTCDLYRDVEVFNVYVNESLVSVGFCAISHHERRIIFAFRGTYSVTNWLNDLTFWRMPYPHHKSCGDNCTVHRGFYLTYESIMPFILVDAIVLRTLYPAYGVLVTGHSLGGALATFCAADLIRLHEELQLEARAPLEVQLYTFGSPRVGNSAFVGWLAAHLTTGRQFRVTHRSDPVPHLPPMYWGYVHLPQEVWYSNGLDPPEDVLGYRTCADSAVKEDPTCGGSTWATSVSDHLSYLDVCTECSCGPPLPPPDKEQTLSPAVLAVLREDMECVRASANL